MSTPHRPRHPDPIVREAIASGFLLLATVGVLVLGAFVGQMVLVR
jgi:hypothetical protein